MGPRIFVDEALEATIVLSFGSLGYRLRRQLFDWQDAAPWSLRGRTALVTGPTSGLGRATAVELADLGARVILVSRSEDKLMDVRHALLARHGGEDRFPVIVADMSSLASVRAAVEQIARTEARLDVVIDSAGAILESRTETDDGIETTFATMVVGPFVLIGGLLPMLEGGGGGRVISVVSGGLYAQPLDLDDLQLEQGAFDGTRAYARAKRASATLAREWARRLDGRPVRINSMHPGWVDTPGLAKALPTFYRAAGSLLRSPHQGIDTTMWLAADPAAGRRGGQLFLDRRARLFDRVPATRLDAADRRRLWEAVVRLSGAPDPVASRAGSPSAG